MFGASRGRAVRAPVQALDKLHFAIQSRHMQTDWAAENLQTIRTLMERSALYRHALAPIMTALGIIGIVAAAIGYFLTIDSPYKFFIFWMLVCVFALAIAFLLVRRQALKDREPFWSPPTRRVIQAISPPLFAGMILGFLAMLISSSEDSSPTSWTFLKIVVPLWIIFYGCALHAAGFFMPRGFKLFGWAFVLSGVVSLAMLDSFRFPLQTHWVMGAFFGCAHLAYGIYLYFTEKTRNAA